MKRYTDKQVDKLIKAVSLTVIALTIFLFDCVCGSVENSASITSTHIITAIVLIVIGIIACITFNLIGGEIDE